jgi:hypothetical protein
MPWSALTLASTVVPGRGPRVALVATSEDAMLPMVFDVDSWEEERARRFGSGERDGEEDGKGDEEDEGSGEEDEEDSDDGEGDEDGGDDGEGEEEDEDEDDEMPEDLRAGLERGWLPPPPPNGYRPPPPPNWRSKALGLLHRLHPRAYRAKGPYSSELEEGLAGPSVAAGGGGLLVVGYLDGSMAALRLP